MTVWLRGLRKVLLLHPQELFRPRNEGGPWPELAGWLFDPERTEWTAIESPVSLSDHPADFGTASSQGQRAKQWAGPVHSRTPSWGVLVCDAYNREAVLVGGGDPWGRAGKEETWVRLGLFFCVLLLGQETRNQV
jgi:hypothetical protein